MPNVSCERPDRCHLFDWLRGRVVLAIFFFFSSRRRHTRSDRDWSSDVCSSDLVLDDANVCLFTPGMKQNVAQAFLNDAEECGFPFWRQPAKFGRHLEVHMKSA